MTKLLSKVSMAMLLAASCFFVTGCGEAAIENPVSDIVEGAAEAGKEAMDKTMEAGKEAMDKTMDAGKEAMSGSDSH